MSNLPPPGQQASTVRTPKIYLLDRDSSTQVLEYLSDTVDLKTYVLHHFSSSADHEALNPLCYKLGHDLGTWLRHFHEWAGLPEQRKLREVVASNKSLQAIRHRTYFGWLLETIDMHPAVLKDVKGTLEEVSAMADDEYKDESKLQVSHGDFCPQK